MWSKRGSFALDDGTMASYRRRAERHAAFVDLTTSNPTSVGLELPSYELLLGQHGGGAYEPSARGLLEAREALAASYRRRGPASSDELLLTASTSEAYYFMLLLLCDPGDAIYVPEPSYPLFPQLAQLAGVRLVPYSLGYDGSFFLDRACFVRDPAARAVFLVSPNNPTGTTFSASDAEFLAGLGLPMIWDEVFRPYRLRSGAPPGFDPFAAEAKGLTFFLDGLSKRAAAPGLKLGWLLAKGPGSEEALARLELISDAFLSPAGPTQRALPFILEREEEAQTAVLQRLRENYRKLEDRIAGSPLTLLRSEAGFSVLLRFPAVLKEEEYVERLAIAGLFLYPGSLFRVPVAPTFSLSLLPPPAIFSEALGRLMTVVDEACAAFVDP